MCMMGQDGKKESCEVAKSLAELRAHVKDGDKRLTDLETTVADMRKESQSGFTRMTEAINALGHDFGERMNLIEKKVVDEKAEWGKVLRKVVLWSAATLLSGAAVAMGVTIWKNFVIK